MADMDGFREANNFGFGQTSQFDNFHVKGASNYSWGMKDRLSRIFNPKTGRAVMLAFDHGFIMGPTSGLERIDLNIVPLVQYADCIMCTRGILQTSIPANINKPVCLRSDAGSTILTELNRNVLIDIEDAIRYNASAMAVMFSAGDGEQEAITAANLVEAVDMGNRYGIPVMGVTAVGMNYYGGMVAGLSAIFATTHECMGYPVTSIFDPASLPDYASYDSRDCPLCKAGQHIDALVNSFGYSAL